MSKRARYWPIAAVRWNEQATPARQDRLRKGNSYLYILITVPVRISMMVKG
jgi:hypothetical protein